MQGMHHCLELQEYSMKRLKFVVRQLFQGCFNQEQEQRRHEGYAPAKTSAIGVKCSQMLSRQFCHQPALLKQSSYMLSALMHFYLCSLQFCKLLAFFFKRVVQVLFHLYLETWRTFRVWINLRKVSCILGRIRGVPKNNF